MSKIKNEIDIVVGIPTLNEEETIENVVSKVDSGLSKYFPSYHAIIVNVDSDSKDKTRQYFLRTPTKTNKESLNCNQGIIGKGNNLFLLIEYALGKKAKYACTVDGDLYSIEANWIKKLLNPLINESADYVTPLYTRNRYEGNTTNHFCVPLLSYAFQKNIRQPIGGEYAFNETFMEYISKEYKPTCSYKYGIDMFLTGHAAGGGFNIAEAWLGRKIHKPSFGKMLPMFKQVAEASYYILDRYKNESIKPSGVSSAAKRFAIDTEAKKPDSKSILDRKKIAIKLFNNIDKGLLNRYLSKGVASEVKKRNFKINSELWIRILHRLFGSVKASSHQLNEASIKKIAQLTLPLYLFRVLTYFDEIETMSPKQIENLLNYEVRQ